MYRSMTLIKLIRLRKMEDALQEQNRSYRRIIYQQLAQQYFQQVRNPQNLSENMLAQQRQFFTRTMENYLQGLKASQTQLRQVHTQIQKLHNSATVKFLKHIDLVVATGAVVGISILLISLL